MTIYRTPYDTSAGIGSRYSHIAQDIQTAIAGGGVARYLVNCEKTKHSFHGGNGNKIQLALIQGGNSFADSVHFFKHPAFIREGENDVVCLDVREFGKWNAGQQRFDVRNAPEYVWAIKRAILSAIWNEGRFEALRDLSNIPAQVYCALVSESIARRFALDAAEQATLSVLAGYFYYGLFSDNAEISDIEKNQLAGKLFRITRIDATTIFGIIDNLGVISSIDAFCDVVKNTIGNVALENLNIGNFFTVISGNWYGYNSRETVCMAMEHIPTWIMIVEASLNSATFKRSTLAKMSVRYDKQGAGSAFSQALTAILGGPDAIEGLPTYHTYFEAA